MKNKVLIVHLICCHCGFPQVYNVPVVEFSRDADVAHYQKCTECNKWIMSFEIEDEIN